MKPSAESTHERMRACGSCMSWRAASAGEPSSSRWSWRGLDALGHRNRRGSVGFATADPDLPMRTGRTACGLVLGARTPSRPRARRRRPRAGPGSRSSDHVRKGARARVATHPRLSARSGVRCADVVASRGPQVGAAIVLTDDLAAELPAGVPAARSGRSRTSAEERFVGIDRAGGQAQHRLAPGDS